MKPTYITYNELLCSKLSLIGFKRKDKNEYVREYNGIIQSLAFIHSARIPHTREYNILVGFCYPEVEKMGNETGIYGAGAWGTNIGYLTPDNSFKTWLVDNSASEDILNGVADEMARFIETYAMPFLNKYSDINELIYGLEKGDRLISFNYPHNLPLLYLLNGEKEDAISFLDRELKRKEIIFRNSNKDCPPEAQDNNNSYVPQAERVYKAYKEFAEKLSARIEQMG